GRPRDLDQSDRLDLRLDARPDASRQAGQQSGPGQVRQHAGEGLHRDGGIRLHDQGPRDPDLEGSALADHPEVPRQDRREPQEGAGGVTLRHRADTTRAASPTRPFLLRLMFGTPGCARVAMRAGVYAATFALPIAAAMASSAFSAPEGSPPPPWAKSARPPPPWPPISGVASFTSSAAFSTAVRSWLTPTTTATLPSAAEVSATTPEP